MNRTERMEISKVRAVVAGVVRDEPAPPEMVQAAQDAVQAMCQEAAAYGLTTADVIKAVLVPALAPVLGTKRGCECASCLARRRRVDEWTMSQGSVPVA